MEQNRIQTLISQSIKGNTNAFAALVTEYQPLIFRLVFRLICNEEDTRDVVQETFIKVWLSLSRFDGRCRFSTWLYKIATNAAYDKLRTLQYTSYDTTDITELHILSDDEADKSIVNNELRDLILSLTAELSLNQRIVFTLRDLEELETSEVETITGLTAAKIKSNLYLARKHIRERMKELNIQL